MHIKCTITTYGNQRIAMHTCFWMLRIIFYMCNSIILNLLILKYETPIFKVFMNAPFNVINSSFAFIAWKENGSLHKTVFRIIFLLNGVFKTGRVSSCIRVEQPRINPSSDVVEWPSTYSMHTRASTCRSCMSVSLLLVHVHQPSSGSHPSRYCFRSSMT